MAITIDKAIEILTINNDHNPNFTDAERRAAHQVGIEALKFRKSEKEAGYLDEDDLLPGETKD